MIALDGRSLTLSPLAVPTLTAEWPLGSKEGLRSAWAVARRELPVATLGALREATRDREL